MKLAAAAQRARTRCPGFILLCGRQAISLYSQADADSIQVSIAVTLE
jgi:hypothetical protein